MIVDIATSERNVQSLPDGWKWVRLGDVCHIIMGQSPDGSSYNSDGTGFPLLNGPTEFGLIHPLPVQWTTSPTRFAEPGDVLLCVRGATTGRKSIADQRYCIGRGLAALRARYGLLQHDLLPFMLQFVTALILSETAGSTFPNLPGDKLQGVYVPLPPLPEQKRIAAILNEQMAAVENARAACKVQLEAAKALPAAYLRAVFESEEARKWERKRLGELASIIQNGIYKPAEFYGHGVPFVRMYNVQNSSWVLSLEPLAQVAASAKETASFALQKGDLLISRVNSFELVGKCGWVDERAEGYVFENMLIRLRLHDTVDTLFIAQQMGMPHIRDQIEAVAKRAIGQSSINSDDVRNLEVMLPPLHEQREISQRVSEKVAAVESAISHILAQLEHIDKLPSAILRKAFQGEL